MRRGTHLGSQPDAGKALLFGDVGHQVGPGLGLGSPDVALGMTQAVPVGLRGQALLADRLLNKDTAFSEEERDALGLRGLLPPGVQTLEQQVCLELEHVRRKPDGLERYIGLAALQDRNETLFYRLLRDNLEELMPVVYTPTVGTACEEFSHIFRRPRGLWLTPEDLGRMPRLLRGAAAGDVRLIVVTDNERILGLGDQGAGGMAIPVGKLAIYVAAAGLHPTSTLAVSLDVGTDNPGLLSDPLYAGQRAARLRGAAYDEFVERFVEAVLATYPRAILQWEDFKGANALRLLERYRRRLASFNDDVQGTGATVLAGVLAAVRLLQLPLAQLRFLVVGAGAAGIGIGRQLAHALVQAGADPTAAIAMIDQEGLIHTGRGALTAEKAEFALEPAMLTPDLINAGGAVELAAAIEFWRPNVLIGTTAVQGRFDEAAIRALSTVSERPVVMALSNPITACEVTPANVFAWSEGRAVIATGSPFDPVLVGGKLRAASQGNNAFVFPGLGLGAIVAEAREVTDGMLLAAANALAESVSAARLAEGALYPPIADLPELARSIAVAVVREARDSGFGRFLPDDAVEAAVDAAMWNPTYDAYHPAWRSGLTPGE